MDDIKQFFAAILRHWKAFTTGSFLAAIVTVSGVFGAQFPQWLAWLFLVAGLFTACYFAWRDERRKANDLEGRLAPRITIHPITEASGGYRRVEVKNISASSLRVRAQMESVIPAVGHPLPMILRPAGEEHGNDVEIPAGGGRLFDVFFADRAGIVRVDYRAIAPGDSPNVLFFPASPHDIMVARQRYEIRICAFPVLPVGGTPARRSFYIIPQPDGSIIFSDAGKVG